MLKVHQGYIFQGSPRVYLPISAQASFTLLRVTLLGTPRGSLPLFAGQVFAHPEQIHHANAFFTVLSTSGPSLLSANSLFEGNLISNDEYQGLLTVSLSLSFSLFSLSLTHTHKTMLLYLYTHTHPFYTYATQGCINGVSCENNSAATLVHVHV